MPTLSELAARYFTNLSGIVDGRWSQDDVKEWIKQALERFALLRPVTVTVTADVAGDALYLVDARVRHVLSVYHVEGDCVIDGRPYRQPILNESGVFYWFIDRADATASNEVYLSPAAADGVGMGDSLKIETLQQHVSDLADDDPVTVPGHQLHLLEKLVAILALENRLMFHAQQTSESEIDWMNTLARRLKGEYDTAVAAAPDPVMLSPFVQWGEE